MPLPALRPSSDLDLTFAANVCQAFILPREGFENSDYSIVVPKDDQIRQMKLARITLMEPGLDHESERVPIAAAGWVALEWHGDRAARLSLSLGVLRPGDYSARISLQLRRGPARILTLPFTVHPGRLLFSGAVVDADADLESIYALTPLGIRMLRRDRGTMLGFIPLPAGPQGIAICRLERHLVALCEGGILHIFELPTFRRKSTRLSVGPGLLRLRRTAADGFLVAWDGGNGAFHVDARGDVGLGPAATATAEPKELTLSPSQGVRIVVPAIGREYRVHAAGSEQRLELPALAPGEVVNRLLPGDAQRGVAHSIAMLNSPAFEVLDVTEQGLVPKPELDKVPFYRPRGQRFVQAQALFADSGCIGVRRYVPYNHGMLSNVVNLAKPEPYMRAERLSTALDQGRMVYCVGDEEGRITFYSAATNTTTSIAVHEDNANCIDVNKQKRCHRADVTALCFHPGGRSLYSGGLDFMLKAHRVSITDGVFDISPSWSFSLDGNPQDIVFHYNQMLLVTTPSKLYLIQTDNGEILSDLCYYGSFLDPIAVMSGEEIYVGDWDGRIHRIAFGRRGLQRKETINVSSSSILALQMISQGTLLAVTEDSQGHLVDTSSKQVTGRYRHKILPGLRRASDLVAIIDGSTYLIRTDVGVQGYTPQMAFPTSSMSIREGVLMLSPQERAMAQCQRLRQQST